MHVAELSCRVHVLPEDRLTLKTDATKGMDFAYLFGKNIGIQARHGDMS